MDRISVDRLKKLLSYDEATGHFHWVVSMGNQTARAGFRAGSPNKDGYWCTKIDGRLYRNSYLAWMWMNGEWPTQEIDHIDRDKSNDSISNLRMATRRQNCINRNKRRTKHMLPKGVHHNWKKFSAKISIDGRLKHLGQFDTAEEASAAYQMAARRLHGEFYSGGDDNG